MSNGLVRSLLRLAANGTSKGAPGEATSALRNAAPREWTAALRTLDLHRITPLAWHGIHAHDLAQVPPDNQKTALEKAHHNALLSNAARLHALAEALDALAAANIEPVVWKGIMLAACFYPTIATRAMGDIDMTIEPAEAEAAERAFLSIGYQVVERQNDAVYYRNSAGQLFDVHHRVKLFEGQDREAITTTAQTSLLTGREFRILAPEALIAHLTCHAEGHRGSMGYVLRWIVDLHFVMKKVSTDIDLDKLKKLIPSPGEFVLLMRFLQFLQAELGTPIPPSIAPLLNEAKPLSLGEILRSRRLTIWGLPGPRGFARLASGRDTTPEGEQRPWPQASDFLLWPLDRAREAMANASAKSYE